MWSDIQLHRLQLQADLPWHCFQAWDNLTLHCLQVWDDLYGPTTVGMGATGHVVDADLLARFPDTGTAGRNQGR